MGYRDHEGTVFIPPKYDFATDFTAEGIAWVAGPDGLEWIDRSGKVLAKAFAFENGADPFVEGRARIISDGLVGFIDPTGKVVVPPMYEGLSQMDEGRAAFCKGCVPVSEDGGSYYHGGEWGYIDGDGNIIPLE